MTAGVWLPGEVCAQLAADPAVVDAFRRLRAAGPVTAAALHSVSLVAAHRRRTLADIPTGATTADPGEQDPAPGPGRPGLWLTTKDTARVIDRSERTVRDLVAAGRLPHRRNCHGLIEIALTDAVMCAGRPARRTTTRKDPMPSTTENATEKARREGQAAYWQGLLDRGAHLDQAQRIADQLDRVRNVVRHGGGDLAREAVDFLAVRSDAIALVGQLVDAIDRHGLSLDQPLPDRWAGPGSFSELLDELTAEFAATRPGSHTSWAADEVRAGDRAAAIHAGPVAWFIASRPDPSEEFGRSNCWQPEQGAGHVRFTGRVAAAYTESAAHRIRASMAAHDRASGPVHEVDENVAADLLDQQEQAGRQLTAREVDDALGIRAALLGDHLRYRGLTTKENS